MNPNCKGSSKTVTSCRQYTQKTLKTLPVKYWKSPINSVQLHDIKPIYKSGDSLQKEQTIRKKNK